MINHLGRLIADYGYLIVALFIFAEGIAIPFPTDSTIVTAAAFAAHGRLSMTLLFVVSTVSASLGSSIAFVLGRRGGDFFERHSRRVNPTMLTYTRGFFARHGETTVLIGRFIPFARMTISPLAGLSTMSFARFTMFNVLGAAIWSAVFCGVGYFFGQHPPSLGRGLIRGTFVVAVGLGVIVTIAVAGGWLVEESDAAWRAEGTVWHRILMSPPMRWLTSRSPAARAFLFRRFTPGDYLGLNLTLGLGLSFVALVIFGAITNTLLARDAVPQFDLDLAAALREGATPGWLAFWGRQWPRAIAICRDPRRCTRCVARPAQPLVVAAGRTWGVLRGKLVARRGREALLRASTHGCLADITCNDGRAERTGARGTGRLWHGRVFRDPARSGRADTCPCHCRCDVDHLRHLVRSPVYRRSVFQ